MYSAINLVFNDVIMIVNGTEIHQIGPTQRILDEGLQQKVQAVMESA